MTIFSFPLLVSIQVFNLYTFFLISISHASSSHVDDEDIEDKPKDYSLQYEENDGAEDNDINVVNHHDLVVDNVEAVTYFAEGKHNLKFTIVKYVLT